MKRQYFLLIVIGGGLLGILVLLFFIFSNPYERLNPTQPEPIATQTEPAIPPSADQAAGAELMTVLSSETIGATTGIDGLRLVFYDKNESKIKVVEYDGTGEQDLSDTLLGVESMGVSPTKEQAWVRLTDPETNESVSLVYDFRAKESVRLENGIQAIDWSPDGSQLVYFVNRAGAAPALKIVESNGIEPRTIRDNFSVEDLVVTWYGQDSLAYWLAPSSQRPSSIISMTASGANAVELSPENLAQQAIFSPDGQYVLVGRNNAATGKPELQLGSTLDRNLQTLPLTTWIEKCTWLDDSARILCFVPRDLPGGFTYPDDDDGSRTYRDQLWVVDAATAKPQLVYDLPETLPDARQPFAAQDASRLNFLLRPEGLLLSLDLSDKLVAPTTPSGPANEANSTGETSAAPGESGTSTDNTTNSTNNTTGSN